MNEFAERFGPWAVVTGASSGIGQAFARRLAAMGINIVLVARREDRLAQLATELGGRHEVKSRIVSVDLATDDFLSVVADSSPAASSASAGTRSTSGLPPFIGWAVCLAALSACCWVHSPSSSLRTTFRSSPKNR